MAPIEGLVQPTKYDVKDSNVELIGSDIDHRVKHASAEAEPAWNDGKVGRQPGLFVWRIEDFEVVPWPQDKVGQFYDGDSYIVLYSYELDSSAKTQSDDNEQEEEGEGGEDNKPRLGHGIFFWLGAHTSQDEAGTAAYKTVELDEFLGSAATQHRETQESPSDTFVSHFPRLEIRRGGVPTGFRHVEIEEEKQQRPTLLRIFKRPSLAGGRAGKYVAYEVEPTWRSLDDNDVFVLDTGSKIWVWQGKGCHPLEKGKAAELVHNMTIAKHVDVEVLSQNEARSRVVVKELTTDDEEAPPSEGFSCKRPDLANADAGAGGSVHRPRRLLRLSDAGGQLSFGVVREGSDISQADLNGDDVFVFDDQGKQVWVWVGKGASNREKTAWLKVCQAYIRRITEEGDQKSYNIPIAKVQQGHEGKAFVKAIAASA